MEMRSDKEKKADNPLNRDIVVHTSSQCVIPKNPGLVTPWIRKDPTPMTTSANSSFNNSDKTNKLSWTITTRSGQEVQPLSSLFDFLILICHLDL